MDVLDQVRDINRDDTPVSETQLNTARQTLLRHIAKETRPPVHTRRRWAGASALVGGVAATAIAISVFAPARIDPAAAAVLMSAADVTISAIDTELAPGQYLRIQTDYDTLMKWDVDMGDLQERFNNGIRADADAGFTARDTRILYVPADRSDDWITDESADERIIDTFGDRSAEALSDWKVWSAAADSRYWPDLQRFPGGETTVKDRYGTTQIDGYRPFYSEMPRDPQDLLDWFRDVSGDPKVADQWVVSSITDVLSANLMPADLRAATLRALALIPGIRVDGVSGNETTLIYQSGDWMWTRTTTVTIDTAQGMIESVAETTTHNLRGSGLLLNTVPDGRTTVTTTVVGSAPQP